MTDKNIRCCKNDLRCQLNDCIHYTDDGTCSIGKQYRVYPFDENVPNIDLRDERVVWWNENYIAIRQSEAQKEIQTQEMIK